MAKRSKQIILDINVMIFGDDNGLFSLTLFTDVTNLEHERSGLERSLFEVTAQPLV